MSTIIIVDMRLRHFELGRFFPHIQDRYGILNLKFIDQKKKAGFADSKRNATPRIREVGFQIEDLSASVSLSCCVADVPETTASLFAKTHDVRHQAIVSPDAGQRERSKWSIRP
jgi:hypothetical protein